MTLAALPNTFHSINCRWEVGIYFVLFIRFSPLDWKKIGKFQTDLSATWLIQRHKKNTHVIAQKIQQQNEQTTSTTNNSKIVKNNRAKKKNTTHLSRSHSASVDIYFLFNFSNHEIILSFIRLFNESAFAITINLLNLALDRLLCIRCDFFFSIRNQIKRSLRTLTLSWTAVEFSTFDFTLFFRCFPIDYRKWNTRITLFG